MFQGQTDKVSSDVMSLSLQLDTYTSWRLASGMDERQDDDGFMTRQKLAASILIIVFICAGARDELRAIYHKSG